MRVITHLDCLHTTCDIFEVVPFWLKSRVYIGEPLISSILFVTTPKCWIVLILASFPVYSDQPTRPAKCLQVCGFGSSNFTGIKILTLSLLRYMNVGIPHTHTYIDLIVHEVIGVV